MNFIHSTSHDSSNTSQCTTASTITPQPIQINSLKNRIVPLSPTVLSGLERECKKEDFTDEEGTVGIGAFGEVHKVIHNITKKTYAIKVLNKSKIIAQKAESIIKREIEIMYKINHPHIMKLINHFEDEDSISLIMPYASNGHLYKCLKRNGKLNARAASQYFLELIDAISYLHSQNPKIVHRDIKPENLLLDDNSRIQLSDFGVATYLHNSRGLTTICGTNEYMAPEIFRGQPYDEKCDIWALGVLLFEMLSGYTPFKARDHEELVTNIKRLKINWSSDFPPLAKNLISEILKLDPKERISLTDMKNHAWFKQNPLLRPILTTKQLSPNEQIEMHMISKLPMHNEFFNMQEKELLHIRSDGNISPCGIFSDISFVGISPRKHFPKAASNRSSDIIVNLNEKINEISDLKLQIEDYKIENSHLKKEIQVKNDNINEQKEKNLKLHEEIGNKEKEMKEYVECIQKNNIEIEQKQKTIEELEKVRYDLEIEHSSQKEKMNLLQRENEIQEKEIKELKNKINILSKIKQYQNKETNTNPLSHTNSFPAPSSEQTISLPTMLNILTSSLRQLKSMFQSSFSSIEDNLSQMKKAQKQTGEEQILEIKKQFQEITAIISQFNDTYESTLSTSITKERTNKEIEFLTSQNKELHDKALLVQQYEVIIETLTRENHQFQEKENVLKNELELNDKIVKLQKEKSKNCEKRYLELKYNIQTLKEITNEMLLKYKNNTQLVNLAKVINEL